MATDSKESKSGRKNSELLNLLDEAIALVPGTEIEVAVLERYGSDRWKERMIAVREKLTDIRGRMAGASAE